MTPEKAKQIIHGCLEPHGFSLLPKGDGRVEIPQKLIQLLSWREAREVYLFETAGGLIVSPDPEYSNNLVGKVISNKGRVRVPYGVLKRVGMDKGELSASIDDQHTILIKSCGWSNFKMKLALDSIPINLIAHMAKTIMNDHEEEGDPEESQEKQQEERPKYQPEVIIPNTRRPINFRPVQNPYMFKGHWHNGELVIGGFSRHSSSFYLIGGYEKLGQGEIKVGYLLATPLLRELLRAARQRAVDLKISDGEWIIKFDPGIREEFRVFNLPCLPHPEEEEMKSLFDVQRGHEFLTSTFRQMETEMINDITDPPLMINNINYSPWRADVQAGSRKQSD